MLAGLADQTADGSVSVSLALFESKDLHAADLGGRFVGAGFVRGDLLPMLTRALPLQAAFDDRVELALRLW